MLGRLTVNELARAIELKGAAGGFLGLLAVPAVLLYAVAAARYLRLWRRRPSLMLLAMLSALFSAFDARGRVLASLASHILWTGMMIWLFNTRWRVAE